MTRLLVLKLGGELVETPAGRANIAAFAAGTLRMRPLVIVHGGGRAVDAALDQRGIAPKKIDGLRITDAETLEVVVGVLAGVANTELVAALVAAGVRAVGLTGADDGLARAARSGSGWSHSASATRVRPMRSAPLRTRPASDAAEKPKPIRCCPAPARYRR